MLTKQSTQLQVGSDDVRRKLRPSADRRPLRRRSNIVTSAEAREFEASLEHLLDDLSSVASSCSDLNGVTSLRLQVPFSVTDTGEYIGNRHVNGDRDVIVRSCVNLTSQREVNKYREILINNETCNVDAQTDTCTDQPHFTAVGHKLGHASQSHQSTLDVTSPSVRQSRSMDFPSQLDFDDVIRELDDAIADLSESRIVVRNGRSRGCTRNSDTTASASRKPRPEQLINSEKSVSSFERTSAAVATRKGHAQQVERSRDARHAGAPLTTAAPQFHAQSRTPTDSDVTHVASSCVCDGLTSANPSMSVSPDCELTSSGGVDDVGESSLTSYQSCDDVSQEIMMIFNCKNRKKPSRNAIVNGVQGPGLKANGRKWSVGVQTKPVSPVRAFKRCSIQTNPHCKPQQQPVVPVRKESLAMTSAVTQRVARSMFANQSQLNNLARDASLNSSCTSSLTDFSDFGYVADRDTCSETPAAASTLPRHHLASSATNRDASCNFKPLNFIGAESRYVIGGRRSSNQHTNHSLHRPVAVKPRRNTNRNAAAIR